MLDLSHLYILLISTNRTKCQLAANERMYNLIDGSKIQALRARDGISQKQLGKIVGVDQSMIGYIEREARRPSVEVLIRLANYFDVTLDDLVRKEILHTAE